MHPNPVLMLIFHACWMTSWHLMYCLGRQGYLLKQ